MDVEAPSESPQPGPGQGPRGRYGKHDLTKGPVVARVDLVHCQEVVEHIEERYLDNHPRFEQRWAAFHPFAAARLGFGGY